MAKNVKILSFVFCFFILVIVGRLFYIQVLKANFFKAQAERNIFKFSYSPGSRGLIFDTKDRLLVINETVFCGTISIPFAKKRWVLEESVNKFKKILLDQLNVEEADVLYDPKSLSLRVCDLDFLQAEKLMLLRRELKNFALELQFDRRIIEPEYVSNIIGYQGSNHFGSDFDKFDKNVPRGVFGIEKCLDEFLSGIDGIVRSVVNVKAERVKFETVRAPKHGLHVKLSINLDWQKRAVDLLSSRRGAIVVIEPNTGLVRVLASTPTFNANFFNFRDVKIKGYFEDPNKPLIDRTLNGQYPPGSVIKMLVAVGLTQRGIELSKVICPGFSMVGNRRINCHKRSGHGSVDLARAITV
ncbi:MAG: penicillin-binding transpeptidase domain-containing protein, partial [Deltaproteobacteria bacterium]|nr:penicillin-binding transpeptidase domain-containing protein [Deltaproteobacteria bacterium]